MEWPATTDQGPLDGQKEAPKKHPDVAEHVADMDKEGKDSDMRCVPQCAVANQTLTVIRLDR